MPEPRRPWLLIARRFVIIFCRWGKRSQIPTRERLLLPARAGGRVWRYRASHIERKPHRHEELELNLVTAGRAAYLTMGRRYDLTLGTAVWLFPDQDHVLLGESPDFEMWIVVWKPGLCSAFVPNAFDAAAAPPHARSRANARGNSASAWARRQCEDWMSCSPKWQRRWSRKIDIRQGWPIC